MTYVLAAFLPWIVILSVQQHYRDRFQVNFYLKPPNSIRRKQIIIYLLLRFLVIE